MLRSSSMYPVTPELGDTPRHADGQSKDSAEQRLQICPLKWDLSSTVVAHIVT